MIAPKDSIEPQSSDSLPNSRKVYVCGSLHPSVRVPFREITLDPTKGPNDRTEINEPVRVYDTSGPWGDPDLACEPKEGLSPLRRDWISARGDVLEYQGRDIRPEDNGYLTRGHEEFASRE